MNIFVRSVLSVSIAAALTACGGGSGGSDDSQNVKSESEVEEPELVLAFDTEPLSPDVFNIGVPQESLEQTFNPGDQIRISWFMNLDYSDGTPLAEGETHLYDSTVYLSSDDAIDETDLELFTLECSMPVSENHACGKFASFITVYSPDNESIFSTSSIPPGTQIGLSDFEVDSTAWLDVIPKEANVIISACLREEPEKCDTFSVGISLL